MKRFGTEGHAYRRLKEILGSGGRQNYSCAWRSAEGLARRPGSNESVFRSPRSSSEMSDTTLPGRWDLVSGGQIVSLSRSRSLETRTDRGFPHSLSNGDCGSSV
jgi:hypothetical protein